MDALSVLSDDSDYDIISPDTSIADLRHAVIPEPPPSQAAQETFGTCQLSSEDIQAFVRSGLGLSFLSSPTRTKRIYVDGIWDGLQVRHVLQLRQAKLSFPSVFLVVGVFSKDTCDLFGQPAALPELERCEVVRHCRWVDEVIPDAPSTLDAAFLLRHKIDYVAIEEGATVDPAYHKLRVKGYDDLKRNGTVILTRRTTGVASVPLPSRTPVLSEPETPAPEFTTDIYGIGY
ncbi:cholinephosphate cytidylyltransferase [Mycena maculata]|uniref:choline-phosphate cytidylyltransferase n=1 Tax=Mycena maculata TaxID=230809 RepID=A0AAD7MJT7_9AGAR|nr:cholinephosphate cytidylyltransferase [Mycena maculata]